MKEEFRYKFEELKKDCQKRIEKESGNYERIAQISNECTYKRTELGIKAGSFKQKVWDEGSKLEKVIGNLKTKHFEEQQKRRQELRELKGNDTLAKLDNWLIIAISIVVAIIVLRYCRSSPGVKSLDQGLIRVWTWTWFFGSRPAQTQVFIPTQVQTGI